MRRFVLPGSLERAIPRAIPWLLPTWFAVASLYKLAFILDRGWFAVDFWIYLRAGRAALAGQDPWVASYGGFVFAAPPPTVLPYMLLALLPEWLALAVSVVVLCGAALFTVRKLKLPLYWLLFPPLAESVLVQNPDILVIALLVAGWPLAALAPTFKIYGGAPLVAMRKWRTLGLASLPILLSLPLLPDYVAHRADVTATLAYQSIGGLSAWGTWWLFVPALLALTALGVERAGWLAVPVLWPYTQGHYACIAIPAVRQRALVAAAFAVPYPLVAPAAVCAWGAYEWVARSRAARAADVRGVGEAA